MAYMTLQEQLLSHTEFLHQCGLQVEKVQIGQGFLRYPATYGCKTRGELCYSTKACRLRNGKLGLATWVRGEKGVISVHKTYGRLDSFFFGLSYSISDEGCCISDEKDHQKIEAMHKAEVFWRLSDSYGNSDYLHRKGVGYYGIRFRKNSYGRVAVIPLRDAKGVLWNCQLLNSDGTKRFLKGARTRGLFHKLGNLKDGEPIGLSESYVTAATCQELVGISSVTAFSCHNLATTSLLLQEYFPNSPLVIFADNDRHLAENKGIEAARAASTAGSGHVFVVAPEFGNLPVDSNHTDWNDLLRKRGRETTKTMMLEMLKHREIL